ncbi:hypothetical protein VPH35_002296 [Triticum aestivum]
MARFLSCFLAQALLILVATLVTSKATEEGRARSCYTPPVPTPASSGQRDQTPAASVGLLGSRSPLEAPPPPEPHRLRHRYPRGAPPEQPPPPPPLSPPPPPPRFSPPPPPSPLSPPLN